MAPMQLIELDIHNVRGIPSLQLKPDGENMVIWGPNGSGKSAVVDAIEFLLTGKISRLLGRGTAGITLRDHGPHIDSDAQDAWVEATIRLANGGQPVKIKRCMARPGTLEADSRVKKAVEPIAKLAERGQLMLTRREILRFVTAEAGTRAQQIEALLELGELRTIRQGISGARNRLKARREEAQNSLNRARGRVAALVQSVEYDEAATLDCVNQQRLVLGGQPLSSLAIAGLKAELSAPQQHGNPNGAEVTIAPRTVRELRVVLEPGYADDVQQNLGHMRSLVAQLRSNPDLQRALFDRELIQLGLPLIDDEGRCPLCLTEWRPNELRERLEQRLQSAREAADIEEEIRGRAGYLWPRIGELIDELRAINRYVDTAALKPEPSLRAWLPELEELQGVLERATRHPVDAEALVPLPERFCVPKDLAHHLNEVEAAIESAKPAASPEQDAWDMLTRLEENVKMLSAAEIDHNQAQLAYKRADYLLASFDAASEKVLGELYDGVCRRFTELYRQMHGPDEGAFQATLVPRGAALDFEVDFHGRGKHPPHALHSEGHQDSMGLCLYLALAERLSEKLLNLVVLDDVVMSIDNGHRRKICALLGECFPDKQFIITTHDRTWARQLRNEGIVNSRGYVELARWSLNTGPLVHDEVGFWNQIDSALERGDVPGAAFRLRRGSEQFFEMACNALGAKVQYRSDGQWMLGDFLPAAIGRYRELLKQAKSAAQGWKDHERFTSLSELDTVAGQIIQRSEVERWALNPNVHYDRWLDFSERDFRPVVEALRDLYGLFRCCRCGGMLQLLYTGPTPVAVRCRCGLLDWNLQKK
jgi:energy-coupling factor transporter ATP-binding protein EcfA2